MLIKPDRKKKYIREIKRYNVKITDIESNSIYENSKEKREKQNKIETKTKENKIIKSYKIRCIGV